MIVERVKHSGALVIYADVGGQLVTRTYMGYTRREAVRLFRREMRVCRG